MQFIQVHIHTKHTQDLRLIEIQFDKAPFHGTSANSGKYEILDIVRKLDEYQASWKSNKRRLSAASI